MRSVTAPHQFPTLLYGGATFDPASSVADPVDALVESDALSKQAVAAWPRPSRPCLRSPLR